MVTSIKLMLLIVECFLLLKTSDFLVCLTMEMSLSEIDAKLEAHDNAWTSNLSSRKRKFHLVYESLSISTLFEKRVPLC